MVSFISSFEIINAVVADSKIFFWIVVSVADAAGVNTEGTETPYDAGVSIF